MLHDPGSYSPPQRLTDITLTAAEKETLRVLAQETASLAALPEQKERARLWRKLNDLDSERPMVWINEIPWHEMNVDDELTLRCADPWARELETRLRHDLRWLSRWGLTYYGCCEPLDRKIGLLRRIPNLRKISMSPWNDPERIIREVAGDYVLSFKPSPAVFVDESWNPGKARETLTAVLDRAKGSHVVVIMKDISTVRYKPQRLWDWARVAMEAVQA